MQTLRALKKHPWIFLLAIAILGVALDLIVIRHGVGATGDAVWYMQGAENILRGYGYGILRGDGFLPTTLYPPFYSIVLAALGLPGFPIFALAGILNALLWGANLFLTGWLIYRLTGSAAASILGSAFTLLCIDLFLIHTWAMSEPLYLTLTLLSLLFMLRYQEQGSRLHLVLAGLAAGLSVVTRYVGISLVVTLCLWILVFGAGSTKRRLADATILGVLGVLPLVIFFIRNATLAHTLAGRTGLVFHAIPAENYANMALTLTSWFLPGIAYRLPTAYMEGLFVGLMILSAGLFAFSVRRAPGSADDRQRLSAQFAYLALTFLVLYVVTFMVSIYLSLAGSPSNWTATQISRYLTPVFPIFLVLAMLVFLRVHRALADRGKLYGRAAIGAGLAFLALYFYTFTGLRDKHIYLGYTEIRNDYPALVAELKALDSSSRHIIASNYELGYFLTGRPVYSMPGEGDELTGIANPDLPQLLQKTVDLLDQGAVLLVYRSAPDETFYYDPLLNDLTPLSSYGDGRISITLYSKPGQDR
jgi:hypothetical protein